jgi:thiosulfate/3-mercaptopyruvate sulfurtransferase
MSFYERQVVLASHLWLKEHIDDPNLVILDTRPKVAYMHGHIKNSISLTIEQVIKISQHGAHLVPDIEFCSELFGSIGIDETNEVKLKFESKTPTKSNRNWDG